MQNKNEKKFKAAVFDLDDTLYPEMDYVKSGFKAVANKVKADYNADCLKELYDCFYISKADVFGRTLKSLNIHCTKEYIDDLVLEYRLHNPQNLRFYDDVRPVLDALAALKIKTAIITDGRVNGQQPKLEALKCNEFFQSIIITDSLGGEEFRKPHAKAYELTAKNLGIDFSEMVYIGDNPHKDFAIKKTYPIYTVRVLRSLGVKDINPQDDSYCDADLTVKSLTEILHLF